MNRIRMKRLVSTIAAVGLLAALAGCGSDSSGQTTDNANANTQPSVSIPSPTSPIPTTTTAATTITGGSKPKTTETMSTTSGGSATCSVPDAFQDFKYTGIDCTAAVAVASDWDSNGKDCNTVDNPNVDAGYHRTCSIQGFTCTAKRDVHSDNRFVTCTHGGQSVRFTWLPA